MRQTVETDLAEAQQAVGEWAQENFGEEQPSYFPLYGSGEEIGEFSTSVLKIAQGIDDSERYQGEVGQAAEMDAIGDVFIYLMDYSYRAGLDIEELDDPGKFIRTSTIYEEAEAYNVEHVGMYAGFMLFWRFAQLSKCEIYGKGSLLPLQEVLDTLVAICEIRGYSFDDAITMAMDDVLDREWDADIQVE